MSEDQVAEALKALEGSGLRFSDRITCMRGYEAIKSLIEERDGLLEAMQARRANEAKREAVAKAEAVEYAAQCVADIDGVTSGDKIAEELIGTAAQYRKQAEENHDGA